jgi:hypothetical protein
MTSVFPRLCALALIVSAVTRCAAADEPLSRVQIARIGKAATALVEVQAQRGQGHASAFCIHRDGWFLTNAHVAQGEITLVLNPSLKTEKAYKARVVRSDKGLDLALLRVEGARDLPALSLGSDEGLEELMDVVAFGFPQAENPAPGRGGHPAISINAGSITALPRQEGRLREIQFDAEMNPGNSGGPVLDGRGKVIGVVRSGLVARGLGRMGINQAIPVSAVARFLARPDASFTVSRSEAVKPGDPVDFEVKILELIPSTAPPDLELVLAAGTRSERRVKLSASGRVYRARAVPFLEPKGPKEIEVVVEYADGSVRGWVEDREIRVGDQGVKLSDLDMVRLGTKPEARTTSGQKLNGAPTMPEELSLTLGGQAIRLDLRNAVVIDPAEDREAGVVRCNVVLRRGKEQIDVASLPVFAAGAARPSFAALREGRFIRPMRSTSPVSYLRFESSMGDHIGQGKSYAYEKGELSLMASQGGVQCQVAPFGNWTLLFGAGRGRNLDVAEYRGAKRHPFSDESPGIELNGNGRGCNMISGEFRVWEFEQKGNSVVRFAVDFVQRCEEKMPPIVGMLRYNSTFY